MSPRSSGGLVELVLAVHAALDKAEVSHAFGGALALAYIAEPRATVDVDVNVFVSVEEVDVVLRALRRLKLVPERDQADWIPVAGIRLRREGGPFAVDVFPSLDAERYREVEARVVLQPFGHKNEPLPFLSAEDLVMFKLSFGRDKDWVDLRAIARARPDVDVEYIEQQLLALRGATMHPRLARLRQLLRDSG